MMKNKYDIYISFRRDGDSRYARTLQRMLEEKEYRVFIDYEDTDGAVSYLERQVAIRSSAVFILLLSDGALDDCVEKYNAIRMELEVAIDCGISVVAVNPDNTFKGIPNSIPEHIRCIVEENHLSEVNFGQELNATVDALIRERIEPSLEAYRKRCCDSRSFGNSRLPQSCGNQSAMPVGAAPELDARSAQSQPQIQTAPLAEYRPEKPSLWSRLFGSGKQADNINSCVYAPASIQHNSPFLIRVFFYKNSEYTQIKLKMNEIDASAVRKEYKTLDIPVKDGDKLTAQLTLSEGFDTNHQALSTTWHGHYTDCTFVATLTDCHIRSSWGRVVVLINDVPAGEMTFSLDVNRDSAENISAEIVTRRFSKIFISYAHADFSQVRGIAEGCKINGSDYFFDRHSLNPGELFEEKIFNYIDNADLFVLCWSRNAAESKWVDVERKRALTQISNGHKIALYPISFSPKAPLPDDMASKYNFEMLD